MSAMTHTEHKVKFKVSSDKMKEQDKKTICGLNCNSNHISFFICIPFLWVVANPSGIVAVIMVCIICCLVPDVATAITIDDKITMYQEENARIEQDIDRIVEEYMKHENDTFTDLKTEESSITLVALFPELKSNTLVQQQLEIYIANNEKIKILREEKIDIAKLKWLLYFGK